MGEGDAAMLEIDVTSDIDRVFSEVGDFFRDQIPFVTAGALNDTAFDIRRRVVGSTWPKAIEQRNRVFPGRVFKVGQKASKTLLEAIVEGDGKFDYVERLAEGGTKVPRGNWIAVPIGNPRRNKGGSIAKAYKPAMLKNSFVRSTKDGKNRVILQKNRDGTVSAKYLLIKRAQINATFRFYEDALDTTMRVFSGHWSTRLERAVRSSVFSGVS